MENKIEKNQQRFEELIGELLAIMDPNPKRPGLAETPHRVWKYWNELLEGQWVTNQEIADDVKYNKCFEDCKSGALVVEKDIPIFSHCEHHLALMYDMKVSIAYIPKDKVIGLSKLGRIATICAKRLQLQEKIGEDIADVLKRILGTEDVAVIIEGKHGCMTARGIKAREAVTKTACLNGLFIGNTALRNEMYALLK